MDSTGRTVEARRGLNLSKMLQLLVFAALFLVVAAFLVRGSNPSAITKRGELLAHIGASAGITLALAGIRYVLFDKPSLRITMWLGTSVTLVLESVQVLQPRRSAELEDVLAGLAGVLVAALIVDALEAFTPRAVLSKLFTGVAAIGAMVLTATLLLNLGTVATFGAEPDGRSCPPTEIAGEGVRLDLRTQPDAAGCIRTAAGGLGVIGHDPDAAIPGSGTTFLSSALPDLSASIERSNMLAVTVGMTTEEYSLAPLDAGIVALLESDSSGTIFQILVRANRIEVLTYSQSEVPLSGTRLRALGLEPGQPYEVTVNIDERTMRLDIDGESYGSIAIDPSILDQLADETLRVIVGNTRSQNRPFLGTVEWIEFDTSSTG